MTNDRDNMTTDPSVSATYRQLADEKAPASLDEKILHRAAAAPRVDSGIGRAWMKPVAWAATVGLSLAIVLEMTQLPQAPLDVNVVAPPAPTEERPALAPASPEPAAAKESRNTKPTRHRSETGAIEESKARPMVPVPAPETTQTTAPEPPALCPEAVREVAEDWYRCIEAQKNGVPAARITAELEEFHKRFPDFQVPRTE